MKNLAFAQAKYINCSLLTVQVVEQAGANYEGLDFRLPLEQPNI